METVIHLRKIKEDLAKLECQVDDCIQSILAGTKNCGNEVIVNEQSSNDCLQIGQLIETFDEPAPIAPVVGEDKPKVSKYRLPPSSKKEVTDILSTPNVATPPVNAEFESLPTVPVVFDKFVPVTFCFVSNTRNFYVHLDYGKVAQFATDLTIEYTDMEDKCSLKVSLNELQVGSLYCYYYSADESYYRVQIVDIIGDKIQIVYVDFGDKLDADINHLYKLIPKFANHPAFALNCFIDDSWLSNVTIFDLVMLDFVNDMCEYYGRVQVCFGPPVCNKFPVKLLIENSDRKSEFLKMSFDRHIPEFILDRVFQLKKIVPFVTFDLKSTTEGFSQFHSVHLPSICERVLNVTAIHVFDISNFILSLNIDENDLQNFTTNFSRFFSSHPRLESAQANSLVTFVIEKFYFRGFILSKPNPTLYKIFSIDFGFVFETESIYPLYDTFSLNRFPPFALLAGLHNIVPNKDSWSLVAINQFKNLIKNPFIIEVAKDGDDGGGKHQVDIIAATKNVASLLKKCKYGKDCV